MTKKPLKIKISTSGAMMTITLFLTHSYISLAALLAAFLHELGHIIAAKIYNIELGELRLGIFGASLTSRVMLCSYKKEIFLCLAGPLVNLISVLILFPFCKNYDGFCALFISASLFLGLLNLLPIYEFDGGRILFCLLSLRLSLKTVTIIIKISSFILIFLSSQSSLNLFTAISLAFISIHLKNIVCFYSHLRVRTCVFLEIMLYCLKRRNKNERISKAILYCV